MRIGAVQKFTLAAMVSALGLVFVFASGMFGYFGYPLLLIASAFTYVLTCEGLYGTSVITFIFTAVIAYFIVPDKMSAVCYAVIIGHFPIFKSFVDTRLNNRITKLCIKLLYCNAWVIAALCAAIFIFKITLPELPLQKWCVVLLLEAVFIVLDALHSFCRWVYVDKIRSGIVPKR